MDSRAGRRAGACSGGSILILADTSAWIEYLRGTGSPQDAALRERVAGREALVTEPVIMEILSGALTEQRADELASILGSFPLQAIESSLDYPAAARIYRACRRAGHTLGSQLDCLIAAVAIRTGTPLLHRDSDFDFIAQHTPLKIHPA